MVFKVIYTNHQFIESRNLNISGSIREFFTDSNSRFVHPDRKLDKITGSSIILIQSSAQNLINDM
jgi:hypothetical protein